jgi:predicted AAA+ superfamily ATPase
MYDAIFYKDIVQRYNIRNSKELMSLSVHLIQNITSLYSNNSFKKYGFKSDVTIDKYIQYLKKTYLFFSLERFTNKGVVSHKDLKKIYCIDNGFAITKSYILSENNGKLLENLVFTELLKYGNKVNKNIFYYKTKEGYEVDFIIKEKDVVHSLIQVCYDLSSQNTLEREVRSLVLAAKELTCTNLIIVSLIDQRKIEVDGLTIKVIPVVEWLTNM